MLVKRLWSQLCVLGRLAKEPRKLLHQWELLADYWAFKRRYGALLSNGTQGVKPTQTVLVVGLEEWMYKVKVESLLAKALQLRGYAPVIVTYARCTRALKYYRLFGFDRFEYFEQYLPVTDTQEIKEQVERWFAHPLTIQSVKAWQFHGVHVGRQSLGTAARAQHRNIDLSDPALVAHLRQLVPQAMRAAVAAEALLDRVRPQVALFLDKDYAGIGALYDVALNHGIDAVQWCGSFRDDACTLKRYSPATRHVHPQSVSDETWDVVRQTAWTAQREQELQQELRSRYEDGRWTSYYNRPYGTLKMPEAIRQQLGLAPSKKTAVVFSHVLWDATFFWGDDLFDDYGTWLVETVRAACANPAVNWVIKPHPANTWKLVRDGVQGELYDRVLLRERIGPLPEHVKVLDPDTDISTLSLFSVADYGFTVRGTVGMEMACRGIPVFTAGTGHYTRRGFTVDAATREEFLANIRRIQEYPRLTSAQTELAKKHAYAMFCLRPWRFTSFARVFLPIEQAGHPLDHNIVLRLRAAGDLVGARDLDLFARWVIDSRAQDFLMPQPNDLVEALA